jgi:hypothetical protein
MNFKRLLGKFQTIDEVLCRQRFSPHSSKR